VNAMRIDELLRGFARPGRGDILVSGLTQDSREVRAGDAFVALAGARHHGIEFAPQAAERGAVVIFAESPQAGSGEPATGSARGEADDRPPVAVPAVWIDQLRNRLGAIAARFFGDPSESMTVIGVTGTNGKTSTVQLLAQALAYLGHRAATIGTLGAGLHGAIRAGERTTPDVIRVHGVLAEFRDAGATHVAMEVSSHALEQHRVDDVAFDVAVFTNLTRDHLDYHGTMEAYGAAKAKLFCWPGLSAAVINVDDAFGRDLAGRFADEAGRHPGDGAAAHGLQRRAGTRLPGRERLLLRYAIDRDDVELRARHVRSHADGIDFELVSPWGAGAVKSPLLGRFNVANLLAVAGALGAVGTPFPRILEVLAALQPVPGRMNRLGGGLCPLVVVDYSHTPDALAQALSTLRAHCDGRLTCVFGCGGERDTGKRAQMGAIAERLADAAIVTDDNPRGEDGDVIVAEILAGMRRRERAIVERDRARAIGVAIEGARAGDVVLIAGKGHETYQERAGVRYPFDDLAVARSALEAHPC
jgi:UDP-N-acetylmuramoyl-L-alanyl-D-glutamate--2,6-diaminopimelate ligase